MSTATIAAFTPQDLLEMPGGDRYELVRGRLVEKSTSLRAAFVALDDYGTVTKVGTAYTGGASYQCFDFDSDPVRRPDVSFIRRGRLNAAQFSAGHCAIYPDLVAEVISPTNRFGDVEQRIHDFHEAGTPLVWVVSPERRFVRIHRRDGTITQLKETDELTGEDVLPGFRCRVADLFPPRDNAGVL